MQNPHLCTKLHEARSQLPKSKGQNEYEIGSNCFLIFKSFLLCFYFIYEINKKKIIYFESGILRMIFEKKILFRMI